MDFEELERLAAYEYKGAGYTPLDNVLTPFWNWSVKQLPPTMAPNLVTLLGFVCVLATMAPVFVFSPTFTEEVPRWVFALAAAGLFAYQTLDAIDGKQARRTKSSSPLGQLFDHGLDACSGLFSLSAAAAATGAGGSVSTLVLFGIVLLAFYMGQWGEYRTGVLRHGTGLVGVTEGQCILMAVEALSSLYGVGWWSGEAVPGSGVPRRWVIIGAVVAGNLQIIGDNLWSVYVKGERLPAREVGAKELGVAASLRQAVPGAAVLLGAGLWMFADGGAAFAASPAVFVLAGGFLWAHVTCIMIVAHMSKSPLAVPAWRVAMPFALAANAAAAPGGLVLCTCTATWAFFAISLSGLLYYAVRVITDITEHLGIYCFKIGGRKSLWH